MPKKQTYKSQLQRTAYFYDPKADGASVYLRCPYRHGEASMFKEVLPGFELENVQRQALVQLLEGWLVEAKEQGLVTKVIEQMLAQNQFRLHELRRDLFFMRAMVEE